MIDIRVFALFTVSTLVVGCGSFAIGGVVLGRDDVPRDMRSLVHACSKSAHFPSCDEHGGMPLRARHAPR